MPNVNSSTWLHGLLSVAWADGQFDNSEQKLITDLLEADPELAGSFMPVGENTPFVPLTLNDLKECFSGQPQIAENFLKTAVMVALADGIYSTSEDKILSEYCTVLKLDPLVLEQLRTTIDGLHHDSEQLARDPKAPLASVKEWLDSVEIHDPKVARFLCKLIPPDCPFERDVVLFGKKIVHIPAMCKINPLYEQLVGLRFRSLTYLADKCKVDVTPYL